MTLVMAWIRKVNSCEELIFASDSRLCGGMRWDQCPKLQVLPRSDCALGFAGATAYAYPLMLQTSTAIGSYVRARDRAMDIHDYRGYLLRFYNELLSTSRDEDKAAYSENEFIFAGYSWTSKEFCIWKFKYDKHEKKLAKVSIKNKFCNIGFIAFAGDMARTAQRNLSNLLNEKYGDQKPDGFDMEPFEVLRDMLIESSEADTIGGPPQLLKIYQHMNCKPVGVFWPEKRDDLRECRTLLGRSMRADETCDHWFIDPYTFITTRT